MNPINPMIVNGIILVDKPLGISSNRVIQLLKRRFHYGKVGHTGTLDPLATGMLPVCINEATKFSQFLLSQDKAYYVTAKLGVTTNTGDSDGEVLATCEVPNFELSTVNTTLMSFVGKQQQQAPMYSALKHQGKPLYRWARQGVEVPPKIREIEIQSIELNAYDAIAATISFTVQCAKGTYVRSLVESIGTKLGVGAHVIELRRLWVNPFQDYDMFNLESESMPKILPIDTVLTSIPKITVTLDQALSLIQGLVIESDDQVLEVDNVKLYSPQGLFLGIGDMSQGRLKAKRLLNTVSLKQQLCG